MIERMKQSISRKGDKYHHIEYCTKNNDITTKNNAWILKINYMVITQTKSVYIPQKMI